MHLRSTNLTTGEFPQLLRSQRGVAVSRDRSPEHLPRDDDAILVRRIHHVFVGEADTEHGPVVDTRHDVSAHSAVAMRKVTILHSVRDTPKTNSELPSTCCHIELVRHLRQRRVHCNSVHIAGVQQVLHHRMQHLGRGLLWQLKNKNGSIGRTGDDPLMPGNTLRSLLVCAVPNHVVHQPVVVTKNTMQLPTGNGEHQDLEIPVVGGTARSG
mmetsp:Transcript_10240/g.22559  ORF Transcript_10240/g.22559 Transcript_10240/m.22559 type:complete len:212 (-) Transcript_10240:487-1122(-)